MKTALVAIAALGICFPALAETNVAEWNPPARYDHPFKGKLTEIQLPQREVVAACRELSRKYRVRIGSVSRGCAALTSFRRCTIIYTDKPRGLSTPMAVRRHEIGHCNGWPADHPD